MIHCYRQYPRDQFQPDPKIMGVFNNFTEFETDEVSSILRLQHTIKLIYFCWIRNCGKDQQTLNPVTDKKVILTRTNQSE